MLIHKMPKSEISMITKLCLYGSLGISLLSYAMQGQVSQEETKQENQEKRSKSWHFLVYLRAPDIEIRSSSAEQNIKQMQQRGGNKKVVIPIHLDIKTQTKKD